LNKKIHRYSLKEICKLTYTSKDFTISIINVVNNVFSLKGTIGFQKRKAVQSAVLVRQFKLNPLDRKMPHIEVE